MTHQNSVVILLYCFCARLIKKESQFKKCSTHFQTIGQKSKLWFASSQSCDFKRHPSHPSHPSSGHRPTARTTSEWNHFNFLPTRTVMALGAVTEGDCAVSYCTSVHSWHHGRRQLDASVRLKDNNGLALSRPNERWPVWEEKQRQHFKAPTDLECSQR